MKRADEEHSRASFDRYLRTTHPSQSPVWEEVAPREEPPDYFLTLGPRRFAVEVTSIVEVVQVSPTPLPRLAIDAAGQRLLEQAETLALRGGFLRGSYAVEIAPIDDFSGMRQVLLDAVLAYLRETVDLPTAPISVIHAKRGREWTIWKFSQGGCYIGMLGSSDAKWEVEVAQELQSYLCQMLTKKAALLQRPREPVILLVLDRYFFAAPPLWQAAVARVEHPPTLSMLARIAGDGEVQVLWSSDGA